jgi:hypothetical protein
LASQDGLSTVARSAKVDWQATRRLSAAAQREGGLGYGIEPLPFPACQSPRQAALFWFARLA